MEIVYLYKVITSENCSRCFIVKNTLNQKNIQFEEVGISSPEGKELIEKYNIMASGTVIDTDKNEIINVFTL